MIADLVETLFERCIAAGLVVATAESCTGGMIAAAITDRAGSSAMFDRGFVTYSNAAKTAMLGVPEALLAAHGAVSAEVADAMARGALDHSPAHAAVAVTGIAGPAGGSPEKPVGLVYIAAGRRGSAPIVVRHVFPGDRAAVRSATVAEALRLLIAQL
jgi:nicotinamide-nucleotide amidase